MTCSELDSEPLVPLTITVTVPAEAKVHDNVEVPEPPDTVAGVRLHEALSLVNETSPVNPFNGPTVMVEVPAIPTLTVTLVGLAVRVKSGPAAGGVTVTVAVFELVVWEESPPKLALSV